MNQVMIITGGSRGIGAATSRLAAKAGYAVCVNYLKQDHAANAVVDQIKLEGGCAMAMAADVSVESDVRRLFETVEDQLGTVTALVNNAGILEKQMRVSDMEVDRLNRIFATNVTGCFLCAKEAIKRMSSKHDGMGGSIVNVSSVASRLGAPGEYVDYAASKGAIDTFTVGLAREVAPENIRVNAVRPGFIHTDIHASGGEPDRIGRVKNGIPMQRGGHPEEVAAAILWLISDAASFVTSTFIDLAGGEVSLVELVLRRFTHQSANMETV
jgi:NAD(P)-dependent dehydrogenase (short-subunit alcohol dehydrogenase family)